MSYPQATSTDNHGLAFEGFRQNPDHNGVFAIGETGFTPKIGASKLPGKYAFGGYYYEQQNTSFFGAHYPGRYGFYWQVDQMLFREPSPEEPAPLAKGPSDGKSVADGKSGKSFKRTRARDETQALGSRPLLVQSLYLLTDNITTYCHSISIPASSTRA